MESVIRVEDVSKSYVISHKKAAVYRSLREEIVSGFKSAISFSRKNDPQNSEELYFALKDIRFNIEKGDRVAIIGRNGAGKSTLLKILSRITKPSSGRIEIKGRLSSLLEVGTGFHPELTGRENIYLNGAILGMSNKEVRKKFEEIVSFSEVERFLDTPVKYYSSGMYVRLAFAVSAHLDPDILLVDEVLAVGDMQFQKKCLGKIREVSSKEKTVLLVSHNLSVVQSICEKALVIQSGTTDGIQPIEEAINSYRLQDVQKNHLVEWDAIAQNFFIDAIASPIRCAFKSISNELNSTSFSYKDEVFLEVDIDVIALSEELTVGYAIYDSNDNLLYWSFHVDESDSIIQRVRVGVNRFSTLIPCHLLNEGEYRVKLLLGIYNRHWIIGPDDDGPWLNFSINGALSASPYWILKRPGLIAPRIEWKHDYLL